MSALLISFRGTLSAHCVFCQPTKAYQSSPYWVCMTTGTSVRMRRLNEATEFKARRLQRKLRTAPRHATRSQQQQAISTTRRPIMASLFRLLDLSYSLIESFRIAKLMFFLFLAFQPSLRYSTPSSHRSCPQHRRPCAVSAAPLWTS